MATINISLRMIATTQVKTKEHADTIRLRLMLMDADHWYLQTNVSTGCSILWKS